MKYKFLNRTFQGFWSGVKRLAWPRLMYILKYLLPYSDKRSIQTKCIVIQNCKFHDPWGRGSCAGSWPYKSYSEIALFFQILLLYSGTWCRQTNCMVMMTGAGGLMLEHGYIRYYTECALHSTLSINITLIAFVLGGHNSAFLWEC